MMESVPAAIIFDFDGVIADSEVRANRTLAESLSAIGLPTSYEDCLRDYCGHNWQETERRITRRLGRSLPSDFRERHRARAERLFAEGFAAVPGAAAFLEALGAMPRAIASSSSPAYLASSLERFGFARHFGRHVYSADGWARGKPHPDIYLAAAKGLGVEAARCLAIEDSPVGAQAALAAGMTVVGFCGASHILDRAAHGVRLRAAGVHQVAADFNSIERIFQGDAKKALSYKILGG